MHTPEPGRRGDYERMVEAEYQSIYRFLFWRHGDRATAEDLTQETFLRAWRGLAGRRAGVGSARAWLLTIARRVSQDHLRRAPPAALPLAEADNLGDTSPSTEDQFAQDDAARHLRRAVLALPEPYRNALALTKIEGLDTAEAARVLGIPRGTVKWRVSRALRLLRERLGPDYEQEEAHVPLPHLSPGA